jgi:hypothetical protein
MIVTRLPGLSRAPNLITTSPTSPEGQLAERLIAAQRFRQV